MQENAPIVYVEDESSFVDHLVYVMDKICCNRRLIHLPHGEEAIDYLSRRGRYADMEKYPTPGLMLVDLKMPRVNGFELLKWIRMRSNVAWMPVVVLTVSQELKDVREAYRCGAQSFLVKPIQPSDLNELLKTWENHWLRTALPFLAA